MGKIISAFEYSQIRWLCHNVKKKASLDEAAKILAEMIPDESVIIPMPGHTGPAIWNGRRLYHVCGHRDGEGWDFPTKRRAYDFVRKNFTGDERAVRLYDLKHCTDMYNPKKAR